MKSGPAWWPGGRVQQNAARAPWSTWVAALAAASAPALAAVQVPKAARPQRLFDIVHACRLFKTRHAFAAKKFMDGGVSLVKRIVEGDHGSGRIDSGKEARGQRVRFQEMQLPCNHGPTL